MKKLYHATHISNRDSILQNGLEPRFSKRFDCQNEDKRVYLFEDLKSHVLDFVGYENIDIWEVELDENTIINDDLIAKNDGVDKCYFINNSIPPTRLKIHKTIF